MENALALFKSATPLFPKWVFHDKMELICRNLALGRGGHVFLSELR